MECDEAMTKLKQHEVELKRLGVEHLYLFGSTVRGARPARIPTWIYSSITKEVSSACLS